METSPSGEMGYKLECEKTQIVLVSKISRVGHSDFIRVITKSKRTCDALRVRIAARWCSFLISEVSVLHLFAVNQRFIPRTVQGSGNGVVSYVTLLRSIILWISNLLPE